MNKICTQCRHCSTVAKTYVYYRTRMTRGETKHYNELRCDHPDHIDIVTGEGLHKCEEMRKDKGWFTKEGPCGPTGKLYDEMEDIE